MKPGETPGTSATGLAWLTAAVVSSLAVCRFAWQGRLGLPALALFALAGVGYFLARRGCSETLRPRLDSAAKAIVTVAGLLALLRHPVHVGEVSLPVHAAITQYVGQVDGRTFVRFGLAAMAIKFLGVISSAFAWHLLLVGQGIRFPFWSKIMTSFLIGRFIGTFLPSTIGLDGYTLYEASRYSNQWSRAITAKALEKLIGITGLFLGMVVTLPFGYEVIADVMDKVGRPGEAPLLAAAIGAVAGGICVAVITTLVHPALLTGTLGLFGALLPGGVRGQVERLSSTVGAYRGQVGLLLLALFSKFVTHFATAVVYFFTALAIGVAGASFWPIVFGSTIQILATVLSPTIAGEGAREAFQALLLSRQLGGVAQAVLSAALGFIAAEAATLWGGAFLWVRKPGWRPAFALVDGKQVDYAWLRDEDAARLDLRKIAAVPRS
jgi:hypothetical protein